MDKNMVTCSHWGMHEQTPEEYKQNLTQPIPERWAHLSNLQACLESLKLQFPDDDTGAIKSAQESLDKLLQLEGLSV